MLQTHSPSSATTTTTPAPRSSRRTLLAASLGALGATVTQAVSRPLSAVATPGPVMTETTNTAAATTKVTTTAGIGFVGETSSTSPTYSGVLGRNTGGGAGVRAVASGGGSAVYATAVGTGAAFLGTSTTGSAADVTSTSGSGVVATSQSGPSPAVVGRSGGFATGVVGFSGEVPFTPPSPAMTGVYGYALADPNDEASGVTGETIYGRGVNGISNSGIGVYGTAKGGDGVHGESRDANGVTGSTSSGAASGVFGHNTTTGYGVAGTCHDGVGVSGFSNNGVAVVARSDLGIAIQAQGRVVFSTAGLTAVPAGQRIAVVRPGVDLTAQSKVLCTLESNQAELSIQRIIKNSPMDQFTVVLSGPVGAENTAKVAWFVIG
jgi:hypothetical protein